MQRKAPKDQTKKNINHNILILNSRTKIRTNIDALPGKTACKCLYPYKKFQGT
jgi:hypothetical protein